MLLPTPRYTPTCVGKTIPLMEASVSALGTPPRVWGKQCVGNVIVVASRYTPTCVGKTQYAGNFARESSGTPPRVWGKLPAAYVKMRGERYTPTCVGKTLWPTPTASRGAVHPHVCGENELMERAIGNHPVHPHVCGENFFLSDRESKIIGTPPRVWGKQQARSPRTISGRYTPTCVGKTRISTPHRFRG